MTQAWQQALNVTAAHNVPYAIGELNAAYTLWSACWGGMSFGHHRTDFLSIRRFKKVIDADRLSIVPDFDTISHFKTVRLDESLADVPNFGQIHDRRTLFETGSRLGKRNLHFRLIKLFRRHRFLMEGWEKDQEKLQIGRLRGAPEQ